MSTLFRCMAALALFSQLLPSQLVPAQERQGKAVSPVDPAVTAEYPTDEPGVLIDNLGWIEIADVSPTKVKLKNGVTHAVTSGAVPAFAVAIYAGSHAEVQVPPGRPLLCICQVPLGSMTPALVRLHPKKDSRELQGGHLADYRHRDR